MTVRVTSDLYSGIAYEDNNIYVMESNCEEGERILECMREHSSAFNVSIDENGVITEKVD